jgi:uncharacterized protein (UPF0332 family)
MTFAAATRLNGAFYSLSFALAYSSMFQTAKAMLRHHKILTDIRDSDRNVTMRFLEHYYTNKPEFLQRSCPLEVELRLMMSDNARGIRNEAFHTGVNNVSKPMAELTLAYSHDFIGKAQVLMK